MLQEEVLTIEALDHSGQGIAHTAHGKHVRVWNALPHETVRTRVMKKRGGIRYGVAEEILVASPDRISASEDHFLSCSPFQILEYSQENLWKQRVVQHLFPHYPESTRLYTAPRHPYEYRNKMEFSFTEAEGILSLAFFARGSYRKTPITGCHLARPELNEVANNILRALQAHRVPASLLKTLMIRSTAQGEALGGIFIREKCNLGIDFLALDPRLRGLRVYYSNPLSPASIPTETLTTQGVESLTETILGKRFRISLLSFLQVNIPMFERALRRMEEFVDENESVIDFYSGIGTIGLSLPARTIHLVELEQTSVRHARENAATETRTIVITEKAAEDACDLISAHHTVIFDPPRVGLHAKLIEMVRTAKPHCIIYLSCNPETQARDVRLLSDLYHVDFMETYNFFPRTPHIENLIVLKKTP